jgi:hypothetical protein
MFINTCLKYIKLTLFGVTVLFLLGASCKKKNSNLENKKIEANIDSSCLNNFRNFADSLDLHKVAHLEDAFESNKNFLDQCDFKFYRSNASFKIAIVQLGLKLNLHFLEQGQHDVDMSFMFYASKRCRKVIREIAFFAFKKEINYPEFMGTTLVYWIIANDPRIKNNSRIKTLFIKCMKLENRSIKEREFGTQPRANVSRWPTEVEHSCAADKYAL